MLYVFGRWCRAKVNKKFGADDGTDHSSSTRPNKPKENIFEILLGNKIMIFLKVFHKILDKKMKRFYYIDKLL